MTKYDSVSELIGALSCLLDEVKSRADFLEDDAIEFENELSGVIDPRPLIEFLEDIGLNPSNLPQSLGDRMAIRDAIRLATVLT